MQRREDGFGSFDTQVFAVEVHRILARQEPPPDVQELVGDLVARVVLLENAVAGQFHRVAARNDVDEHAPTRKAVESGRHARGEARRYQSGSHSHEELHATRGPDQRGSGHPSVLAASAGGQERAFVAEGVDGTSHLSEIVEVEHAPARRRAQVAAVTVRRDEPEKFHDVGMLPGRILISSGGTPDPRRGPPSG